MRRWDTPTDTPAVMAVHRRLSSATLSNDDIDWPVHSLTFSFTIYAVNLCDAFRPRSPVV